MDGAAALNQPLAGRLSRRLEALRAEREAAASIRAAIEERADVEAVAHSRSVRELAAALAAHLDGEVVETSKGVYVRCGETVTNIPVDREAVAVLPGMPPPGTPLLCLDTETTGLGTAAGTVAWMIGLGRWEGTEFRQVQLLLPDLSEEAALLDALEAELPRDGALVTYNGRTFDWPLLVTRFRLLRRPVPEPVAQADLLHPARRLFRHRLPDARLQTVEAGILGSQRVPDVPSWQIPSLYQEFLRTGRAHPLVSVARHNLEDVASLAILLAFLGAAYGDPRQWPAAPSGDLVGLARLLAVEGRIDEAIECLGCARMQADTLDMELHATLTLARLQRRAGRVAEALALWRGMTAIPGSTAAVAWIELAKHHEHRERDFEAALAATDRAIACHRPAVWGAATRDEVRVGRDLAARRARLLARLDSRARTARLKGAAPGGNRAAQPAADGATPGQRRRRSSTAERDGTPSSPGPSTEHAAAAAASRSERAPAGTSPASHPATSAARNTSPAPVASTVVAGRAP